jgi:antitoxin (DNA-binding transcriptional repressor) of toxin-antitoxin stability system
MTTERKVIKTERQRMKTIELMNQPPNLETVLELAAKEAGVVLTKSGQPVAQVIPLTQPVKSRIAPLHPGGMEVSDDFDAPLPDEFWLGKE